jgi:hypothetical protein
VDVEALAAGRLGIEPPWDSHDLSRRMGVPEPAPGEQHTAIGDARWAKAMYEAAFDPKVTRDGGDGTAFRRLDQFCGNGYPGQWHVVLEKKAITHSMSGSAGLAMAVAGFGQHVVAAIDDAIAKAKAHDAEHGFREEEPSTGTPFTTEPG